MKSEKELECAALCLKEALSYEMCFILFTQRARGIAKLIAKSYRGNQIVAQTNGCLINA